MGEDGRGRGWDGRGWEMRGWEGKGMGGNERGGEGLLNFHFSFNKTWAEPGDPSIKS